MKSSRTFLLYTSVVTLTLLAFGAAVSGQARATYPIAYISVQRLVTEAEDAKAASKEFEALRAAKAQEVNAQKQALDATKLQIANSGGFFSASKREQLQQTEKRQETDLLQITQQAQTDLTDFQKKIQDRLREELGSIVTALAQQRGVQYVLNQDVSIVLAPKGANWTDEVLERMNAAAAQRANSETSAPDKTRKKQ